MEEKKNHPHLFNLNFDPQLSGRLVHIVKVRPFSSFIQFSLLNFQKTDTEIGNTKGKESDIVIVGPG